MPTPESSPVSVAEKKTSGRERFVRILSGIPGVSLRYEPGVEPDILKRTIGALHETARKHAHRYFQIKGLQDQQKVSDKEIKTLAKTHEGLRGIQSEEDNFTLNVFPKDSVSWDP